MKHYFQYLQGSQEPYKCTFKLIKQIDFICYILFTVQINYEKATTLPQHCRTVSCCAGADYHLLTWDEGGSDDFHGV